MRLQIGIGAARVLQGSSRLKKLNMQNARLEIQGTVALANALAACTVTTLVELELSGCRIQKEGMLRLLQVLQGFAAPALEVCCCHTHASSTDNEAFERTFHWKLAALRLPCHTTNFAMVELLSRLFFRILRRRSESFQWSTALAAFHCIEEKAAED